MKKTSFIILTLVASLTISLSSAEGNTNMSINPSDFLYEADFTEKDTVRYDTIRNDSLSYYQQPVVINNYYYRSRFFNTLFRVFRPTRYYRMINTPGYVPRHPRSPEQLARAKRPTTVVKTTSTQHSSGHRPGRSTSSRNGFGHHGSGHSSS